jgi:hypothetical protein
LAGKIGKLFHSNNAFSASSLVANIGGAGIGGNGSNPMLNHLDNFAFKYGELIV